MSDYLAIGGVTSVLTYLLANSPAAGDLGPVLTATPAITAVSPDMITAGPSEAGQLNLYMYYVSLNAALRNLDLPSYDAAGNRVANPPLALDLHYLVSAYGSGLLTAEVLLGWAMKVFHDNPVVPAATIQEALDHLASGSSAAATLTAASTLATQAEHIRITPQALTTEEIYRMWPAFQAPYRPSTAYRVSVVVIQDTTPVTAGPPVQRRHVLAMPLQTPVISGLSPATPGSGQVLTIAGANFLGQTVTDTQVSFDNGAPGPVSQARGNLVTVTLPASLLAGTRTVRVLRNVTFPGEAAGRPALASSPATFQLLPSVTGPSPASAARGASLTLTVSPPVGQAQQVVVYFGDTAVPLDARPVSGPPSSDTVAATVPATMAAGSYPLRVEVDGASSLLTLTAGQWTPTVQVT
jgi:Pvc16 N-terminal domain/IPT/TIG domain